MIVALAPSTEKLFSLYFIVRTFSKTFSPLSFFLSFSLIVLKLYKSSISLSLSLPFLDNAITKTIFLKYIELEKTQKKRVNSHSMNLSEKGSKQVASWRLFISKRFPFNESFYVFRRDICRVSRRLPAFQWQKRFK